MCTGWQKNKLDWSLVAPRTLLEYSPIHTNQLTYLLKNEVESPENNRKTRRSHFVHMPTSDITLYVANY